MLVIELTKPACFKDMVYPAGCVCREATDFEKARSPRIEMNRDGVVVLLQGRVRFLETGSYKILGQTVRP